MSLLEAIVLGIVQGLTEFLPISSTAHLRIVPAFAGWEDPGAAFTAVTQLGTLAAVLLYFRHDLLGIARAWLAGLRDPDRRATAESRLGWYILVGTIPILVFGFLFSDQIETGARNLRLIGTTMIVLGLVLLAAEKVGTRSRELDTLRWRDGVLGRARPAAALVPGVSRSGATISAGLFLGLERAAAARYSFLLSVPAVVLSGLYELREIGGNSPTPPSAQPRSQRLSPSSSATPRSPSSCATSQRTPCMCSSPTGSPSAPWCSRSSSPAPSTDPTDALPPRAGSPVQFRSTPTSAYEGEGQYKRDGYREDHEDDDGRALPRKPEARHRWRRRRARSGVARGRSSVVDPHVHAHVLARTYL